MTRKATARHLLSTPVLPVHEMAQAIDFYQRLGLSIEVFDAGYALVMTGGHEQFHLRLVPDLAPELNESGAYLHVGDVEPLYVVWAQAVTMIDELGDRPWGMSEFSFADPSGNLIRVSRLISMSGRDGVRLSYAIPR
jgi:catechol 2,3-dioxygenase-like lactoylglutathione lyase family enzyme